MGDYRAVSEIGNLVSAEPNVRIETDKPIYQPGQTLHLRTITTGADGHALSGNVQKLTISREDGDPAHIVDLTASKFGIASTGWAIPQNASPGTYTVKIESDDFSNEFSQPLTIRPYELPSFRVNAAANKPYYVPGETATASVTALYMFGKPVQDAVMRLERDGSDQVLWTCKLDSEGKADVPLTLDSVAEGEKYADTHFIVFATDPTTSRTEERKFDARLSLSRLHLYLSATRPTLSGERLYLSVFQPDGTPARGATVHAGAGEQCSTNRYGLCAIDLAATGKKLHIYADNGGGDRSAGLDEPAGQQSDELVVEADHVLHRRDAFILFASVPAVHEGKSY